MPDLYPSHRVKAPLFEAVKLISSSIHKLRTYNKDIILYFKHVYTSEYRGGGGY